MTDEIRDFSLISLTDDLNNIAVKLIKDSFKQTYPKNNAPFLTLNTDPNTTGLHILDGA